MLPHKNVLDKNFSKLDDREGKADVVNVPLPLSKRIIKKLIDFGETIMSLN